MDLDRTRWVQDMIRQGRKRPLPVLSFPGIQITGYTVEETVRSGQLQAECMQAVADRFDMAAVLGLMDLSVEAEAFGSPVRYSSQEVPTVTAAIIQEEEEAEALQVPEVGAGRTGECLEGIRKIAEVTEDRPVFAGMIGPYSLAGRLLDMTEIMILCYEEPEMVETVLEKVTGFLCDYARAFKEAGAHGIVMAEPAAGLLSPGLFREFSVPYVKRICQAAEEAGPCDDLSQLRHGGTPSWGHRRYPGTRIQFRERGEYGDGAEADAGRQAGAWKHRSGGDPAQRHTGGSKTCRDRASGNLWEI